MSAGGSEVGVGYISLVPSAKGFGTAAKSQLTGETASVGSSVGSKMGKDAKSSFLSSFKGIAATLAGLFVVRAGVNLFKDSISEAREAQKVQAVTAQVIKTTGNAAHVSAKQVADMASAMERKVGIDDEEIKAGSNVLLTFKNISNQVGAGNDIFTRANQSMLDMSAVLKTDLPGAAKVLGKALNDPIQGMSAMTRYGIQFTDQQKKQIETLVKSGKTLDAQKIILGELESKFGGAAAAAATNSDKYKVAVKEFKESFGTMLLPIIDWLTAHGTKAFDWLGQALEDGGTLNKVFKSFGDYVKNTLVPHFVEVRDWLQRHLELIQAIGVAIGIAGAAWKSYLAVKGISESIEMLAHGEGMLSSKAGLTVVAIGILAGAAYYAYKHFQGFHDAVDAVGHYLRYDFVNDVQAAYNAVKNWLGPIVGWAQTQWSKFMTWWRPVWAMISELATAIAQGAAQTWRALEPVMSVGLGWLQRVWSVAWVGIQNIAKTVWFAVQNIVKGSLNIIGGLITTFLSLLTAHWSRAWDGVKAIGSGALDVVRGIVGSGVDKVVDFFAKLPGRILDALGNVGDLLYQAGKQIIEGLINGMQAMVDRVADTVKDIGEGIKIGTQRFFGIGSPSKLMMGLGRWITVGLAQGILAGSTTIDQVLGGIEDKISDAAKGIVDQINSIASNAQQYAASATQTVLGMGNIVDAIGNGPIVGSFVDTMQAGIDQATDQAKWLLDSINQLQAWHLRKDLMDELIQGAGTVQGRGAIAGIVGEGKSGVDRLNASQAQLAAKAAQFGQLTAQTQYQGDVLTAMAKLQAEVRNVAAVVAKTPPAIGNATAAAIQSSVKGAAIPGSIAVPNTRVKAI